MPLTPGTRFGSYEILGRPLEQQRYKMDRYGITGLLSRIPSPRKPARPTHGDMCSSEC